MGSSLWSHKELDMIEATWQQQHADYELKDKFSTTNIFYVTVK